MNGDWRAAGWVALGFAALHLAMAAALPLIGDEGYYTLWASALAWDYYDHPPMIAAMIRAGTLVFGTAPLGVRLVPVLGMALASLAVADMAPPGMRARAAAYFNVSLLVFSVGGFATPDAPSTLFWTLASAATLRASRGQGLAWWLAAGLMAGLGVMSKFTNLFLGIGIVVWLLATRPGRACLRGPGPWLALLVAALPVLPLIWWNLAHHGLGLERQFGRITSGAPGAWHLPEYLALLVLAPGPVIAGLALRAAVRDRSVLPWTLAPLLAYFALHALHAQVQANWVIPISGAVAVLAAAQPGRWHRAALWSGAVLSAGLMAAAFNPWVALGSADTPPNQTRGWPELLAQVPAQGWIATTDYMLTGQLYAALPGRQVWSVAEVQRYGFRGAFPADLCASPGWLIEAAGAPPQAAAGLFTGLGPAQTLTRRFGGTVLKTYRLRPFAGLVQPQLCP